jgi:hypothetical protein
MEEDEPGLGTLGRHKKCVNILVGKPLLRRSLGRPRRRWEDNIRIDLTKVGWIYLAQGRD